MTANPTRDCDVSSAIDSESDLYRCAPLTRLPVGPLQCLVHSPMTGGTLLMSNVDADVLASCSQFAPLKMHLEKIRGLGANWLSDERNAFKRCAESGLLVSLSTLLERLPPYSRSTYPELSWVAIPASGSGERLAATLESVLAEADWRRPPPAILVADNSQHSAGRATCISLAARAQRAGHSLFYFGAPEAEQFQQALLSANRDIPRAVMEFALTGLDPIRTGVSAARNAILLQTLGALTFSLDDGVVCSPTVAKEISPLMSAVRFSHGRSEDYSLGNQGIINRASLPVCDIFEIHERFLGASIGEVLKKSRAEGTAALDSICPHLLNSVWTNTGRIVITAAGLAGGLDCNIPETVMMQSPTSSFIANETEHSYKSARAQVEGVRQVPICTVSHVQEMTLACAAFDNREYLPPVFGDDDIGGRSFSLLVRITNQHAYRCEFPWAHYRSGHEPQWSTASWMHDVLSPYSLLRTCVSCWDAPATPKSAEEKSQLLGGFLKEVADLPTQDLFELINRAIFKRVSDHAALLHQALKTSYSLDNPTLTADLISAINNLTDAIKLGWPGAYTMPGAASLKDMLVPFARSLRLFGEQLVWWPVIVDTTRRLADRGITPGVMVPAK